MKKNKLSIDIKTKFLLGGTLLAGNTLYAEETKPNIIFILADDLGYSELGCYGNTFNETPVLDSIARNGVRFTHAHTAASLSSPTRAALMTGQAPYRVGVVDFLRGNSFPMRTDVTTIAETLKTNGYHTGIIGKWHLTGYKDSGASTEIFPGTRGFQEVMVSENKYIADGTYFHPYHFNTSVAKVLPGEHEFLVDRMNYEAVEFIKRNKEQAFFLYLSHYAVHTQLMGDPATVDYFRQKQGAGTSNPSAANPNNNPYTKYPADYTASRNNPHLAAQLKHIDNGVGEILKYLNDNGLMENTLVIFTSDNGGAPAVTTNAPLRGGKTSLYEGGTRVPLILYGYGTENSPNEIDSRIITMDFFPTFCELTKTASPLQPCDGTSILPLLAGESLPDRDFFWYYPPIVQDLVSDRRNEASVISGNYKLIEGYLSYGQNRLSIIKQELFNLADDPAESNNIAATSPEIVEQLSGKMKQWRIDVNSGPSDIEPQIIYASPTGTGTGSSWSDVANFNAAVQLARTVGSHQIWLKEGTYSFTSSVNFDGLFIYGGFAGTEEKLNERNWHSYPVILDGNDQVSPLRNRTTITNTPIPCILDGVIVQNGLNPTNENGGGMITNDGTIIRNCIFRNNRTRNNKNGSAIHCHVGTTIIENSLFVNNTSSANGGAIQVGGGTTKGILINCTLTNNKAEGLGGGVGTGANTSNCIFINTIACNNLSSGSVYNSYAQNTDVNNGGKITSIHSAIESTSTKFKESDDVNHISLSENNRPKFVSASQFIGRVTSAADIAAANAASYALAEGSICIDAGKVDEALDILLDLAGEDRIQGASVDIGAYEFKSASALTPTKPAHNIVAFVAENELYISGAEKGKQLNLYDIKGSLIYSRKTTGGNDYMMIRLEERGVYFLKIGKEVIKIRY